MIPGRTDIDNPHSTRLVGLTTSRVSPLGVTAFAAWLWVAGVLFPNRGNRP